MGWKRVFFTAVSSLFYSNALHHDNRGFIIGVIPDYHRHFRLSGKLRSTFAAVSGYDFIAAARSRSCNPRHKHPILADTLRCFLHLLIILHPERVVFEGVKLCQRRIDNLLCGAFLPRRTTE